MHLKLATRLIWNSLLLSITPILIISIYTLHVTSIELETGVEEQLNIERDSRLNALNEYYEIAQNQLVTLAKDGMVINAMKDFSVALNGLESDLGKLYDADLAANENLLRMRYAYQESNTPGAPSDAMSEWWPKERATRILQHYYIAANPYPVDKKQNLDFAADGSRYSQVHRTIHPMFRDFIEKFHYDNMFLLDTSTGIMLYNVKKRVDFATNFLTGPYSETNLAQVFKAAAKSDKAGTVYFVDVEAYAPYFNKRSAFIATPIFDSGTKVGVLAVQLSRQRLEQIITNNHHWEGAGLGKTGESFLVGSDHLLRSEARLLIEDPSQFLLHLKANGIAGEVQKAVEQHKTAIKTLEFPSPAVDAALSGKSGIIHGNDSDGDPAVLAYAPLSFHGTTWALIASKGEGEAFAVFNGLRDAIVILSVIIAGLSIFIGWLFARTISIPIAATINTLSSSSTQMAATTAEQERIANQQAASVNETNTTMEELGISSKQSAQQAQVASESTQTVLALADEGMHQVQDMLQGMEGLRDKVGAIAQQILKLSEQTSQIGNITGLVTDFANETKMLAMNAAVEAVRAGEHGKGFSVLSVEIRKLAEESRRSAERINALVADVQKATNATVMATEEGTKTVETTIELAHITAASFSSVSTSMHTASESAQQISLNIKQQAEAIRQVVTAMNDLRTGAREGAAGISQTKAGIQALNEAAQKLKAMT